MLEKERQAMRKETQGQHEKINQGIDTVSHRVTELEHSEYPRGDEEEEEEESTDMGWWLNEREKEGCVDELAHAGRQTTALVR